MTRNEKVPANRLDPSMPAAAVKPPLVKPQLVRRGRVEAITAGSLDLELEVEA